jgi:hypothetical protein
MYVQIVQFCGSPKFFNSIYLNSNLLCASLDVRRYVIEVVMCNSS